MNKHARLKAHFSVIAHSLDLVELRYGVWNASSFTIRDETESGKLYQAVLALDGSRSSGDVARLSDMARSDIEALIDYLDELGVIEFGPTNALDFYTQYFVPSLTPHSSSEETNPRTKPIIILGDEELTRSIERTLKSSLAPNEISVFDQHSEIFASLNRIDQRSLSDGLRFRELVENFSAWDDALLVVAQCTVNPMFLETVNRICFERKVPWISAAVDGPFVLIGPTIVPNRTACYQCFETRVTMNLRESASYQRYKVALINSRIRRADIPLHSAIGALLSAHCSLEAINFGLTSSNFTTGKVLSIYLPTMEFAFQEVLRLPTCPTCGSQPGRDDSELYFDLRRVVREE